MNRDLFYFKIVSLRTILGATVYAKKKKKMSENTLSMFQNISIKLVKNHFKVYKNTNLISSYMPLVSETQIISNFQAFNPALVPIFLFLKVLLTCRVPT